MKFYNYKYIVKTDIEKAFNYFLKKKYLLKYFSKKELEDIELVSEYPNENITEGEHIEIIFNDIDLKLVLKINVVEIKNNELIHYNMVIDEISDKEVEEDDEEDFGVFLDKFVGKNIEYKISFESYKGSLIINEECNFFMDGFWSKIFIRLWGIYYNFSLRKTHNQVKNELENI